MRTYRTTIAWVSACAGVALGQAQSIDFEAFSDGQDLHGIDLGGVTLTARGGTKVLVYADNQIGNSYRSPVNSVIAYNARGWVPLVGEFDGPQSFVRLWGGDDAGDEDQWELEAFDGAGESLGVVRSPVWNGAPYASLEVRADGIVRFEARFVGQSQFKIAFDDIEFVPQGDCRADLNGDGALNTVDFIAFLNAWSAGELGADWNGDGAINTQDFLAYLNEWASGC
jgi:hypothetical protein